MLDLKTGKEMTRRSALKGLAAILAAGVAPSLCGSITRGIGYRNLAGRMAMFSGGGSIPDWWTPLLTALWPNQTAFAEYPQDTANYNDIYATY